MKTGQISKSTGFSHMDGVTRQLTIREQLLRNKQFVGINQITHPRFGIIDVNRQLLDILLGYQEGVLLRLKKDAFTNNELYS